MGSTFVSVGVTVLDVVGYPINAIPVAESTEIIEHIEICVAGTAAAPAVIAARLGMDALLIGAIGRDDKGDFLLSKLQREGVNTTLVQRRDDMPTATTILPINHDGARPNWHMPGAFLLLEPTPDVVSAIVQADFVHWGGVGMLLNIEGEKAASILQEARSNGATITADLIAPGDHTLESVKVIARYLDYFMPSYDEALLLSGLDTVEAAANFFLGLGVGGCIIKCGGKGAYHAAQKGDERWIPAIRDVVVKDTSGCGDAFCAGFSVGLSHGFTPIDACRFAAATAAQVASGVGSGAGVKDVQTTIEIMQAGSFRV